MSPMSFVSLVSVPIATIIAVVSLVHTVRQSKGAIHLTHARGFFELKDLLAERGPLVGPDASKNADSRHAAYLSMLEREGRASSYLFARRAARLRRPGEFPVAVGQIILGGGLLAASIVSVVATPRAQTDEQIGALISAAILLIMGSTIVVVGAIGLARRLETRRIRDQIGLIDLTTAEGATEFVNDLRRFVAQARSRTSSPAE